MFLPDPISVHGKALYKTTHEPFSKGSYVIGSGEKMELTADIVNSGEDAFNAVLFLQIPRGINYISANTSNSQVRLFVCTSSGAS